MSFDTPDLANKFKSTITAMAVKYDVKVPATNEKVLASWIIVVKKSALQIISNDEIQVILNAEEADLDNLPNVEDNIYIFEKESSICDGKYVLKEINDNEFEIILRLIKEDLFERPVTIQMLVESDQINKEVRESLLSYINKEPGESGGNIYVGNR